MKRKKLYTGALLTVVLLTAFVGGGYAIFSDNVASDDQKFTAGTVDIVVDGYEGDLFETTVHMPNMEAGDCRVQTLRVHNAGTLPVNLWDWIYPWHENDGFPNIFACDPNEDCNMDVWREYISDNGDNNPGSLKVNETEVWELHACLPLCAGNLCQKGTGTIRMFFHAVQQSNLEGYKCVKLEDKADPDWLPNPITPRHGNVCYKAIDTTDNQITDALHIIVNAYSLTGGVNFQLDLTGGNQYDPDGPCTPQDAALAGMPGDLYTSGYWNSGPNLESSCTAGIGEGVWNFAGVSGGVQSDGSGAISYEATLDLPPRDYIVKTQVKEIGGLPFPGTSWTVKLSGLDYLRFTIGE